MEVDNLRLASLQYILDYGKNKVGTKGDVYFYANDKKVKNERGKYVRHLAGKSIYEGPSVPIPLNIASDTTPLPIDIYYVFASYPFFLADTVWSDKIRVADFGDGTTCTIVKAPQSTETCYYRKVTNDNDGDVVHYIIIKSCPIS